MLQDLPPLAEQLWRLGQPLIDVPALRGLAVTRSRPKHRCFALGRCNVEVQLPAGIKELDSFHPDEYRRAGKQQIYAIVATVSLEGEVLGRVELEHGLEGPLFATRPLLALRGATSQHLREALQLLLTDIQNWRHVPQAASKLAAAYMWASAEWYPGVPADDEAMGN